MFRMAVGHVSHDERPSIAMREVEFEGQNVDTKTQPFDYKHVAKTRRESRISAKYFCRGKEICSLQYRLLRFLTPTPESASWLPIQPQVMAKAMWANSLIMVYLHRVPWASHRALYNKADLGIKTRQGPGRSLDGGFGTLAVCGQAPPRRRHGRLREPTVSSWPCPWAAASAVAGSAPYRPRAQRRPSPACRCAACSARRPAGSSKLPRCRC